MKSRNIQLFVILIIMFCTFLVNNNILEANIMESRNLVTAREMLEKGNWFYPSMNGEQRLEKPPLPTWLAAAAMVVFGQDNMALLRLPAVLAGMLLIFFLFRLTEELSSNTELPFLVAGTAASSFYILFMARDISWDIFCHSFMIGAIWQLHRALKNRKASWGGFIAAGILMGLSGLSKGPVAFYSLLLPYLLARGFVYGWKGFTGRKAQIATMVFIAIVIGFLWPLYAYFYNPGYSVYVAQKESSAWISRNVRPFYHYWSFPVQSGIWTLAATIALVFPYAQKRINSVINYRLIAGWIWFTILLLSMFPEKKERYLLPVLLPLSILTAGYFNYLIEATKKNILTRTDNLLLRINAIVLAITCFIIPNVLFFLFKGKGEPSLLTLIALMVLFLFFALLFIEAAIRKSPYRIWGGMVGMMMLSGILLPVLSKITQTNPEYHSYQELRHDPVLDHLPFFYNGEVPGKFIEVVWSTGREIKSWDPAKNPNPPINPPFVFLSHQRPEAVLSSEFLTRYEVEIVGHYDKNLQEEKRQDVLSNYVSIIKPK